MPNSLSLLSSKLRFPINKPWVSEGSKSHKCASGTARRGIMIRVLPLSQPYHMLHGTYEEWNGDWRRKFPIRNCSWAARRHCTASLAWLVLGQPCQTELLGQSWGSMGGWAATAWCSPQARALQRGGMRQRGGLLPSCSSQAWRSCLAHGCCTASWKPPYAEGPRSHHLSHCCEVLEGGCMFLNTSNHKLLQVPKLWKNVCFSKQSFNDYSRPPWDFLIFLKLQLPISHLFFPKHITTYTFYNMHCQIHIVSQLIKLSNPFHLISKYLIQLPGLSGGGNFIFPIAGDIPGYVDVGVAEFGLSHVLQHVSSCLFSLFLLKAKVSAILLVNLCDTPMVSNH